MLKKNNQQVTSKMITLHEYNYNKSIDEIYAILIKNKMSLSDTKEMFEFILERLEHVFYIGGFIGDDYNIDVNGE